MQVLTVHLLLMPFTLSLYTAKRVWAARYYLNLHAKLTRNMQ
jgi:hypothetical protein